MARRHSPRALGGIQAGSQAMKLFGTSRIGCEVLFCLFASFGLLMAFVYHDGGYSGTEPVVVLGGCSAGALLCVFRLLKKWARRAA